MNAEILNLRDAAPPKLKRAKSKPAPAAEVREAKRAASKANASEIRAQRYSAGLLGGVAAVLTGLSLSHLADGIALITHASGWQPWAMAVGIDIGMAATELAALTAGPTVRAQTRWYSASMLAGTLGLSAAMNSFEFASQASSLPFEIAGGVFGLAVPAAVYVLIRQAASHYLDSHRRS
jgi:F0F1-type ATP synthase assembly protein I